MRYCPLFSLKILPLCRICVASRAIRDAVAAEAVRGRSERRSCHRGSPCGGLRQEELLGFFELGTVIVAREQVAVHVGSKRQRRMAEPLLHDLQR